MIKITTKKSSKLLNCVCFLIQCCYKVVLDLCSTGFSFLLPRACVICQANKERDDVICSTCLRGVNYITDPVCEKCGYPLYDNTFLGMTQFSVCHECTIAKRAFVMARSVCEYNSTARRIVLGFKYNHNTHSAKFVADSIISLIECNFPKVDVLCIVPTNRKKVFQKGFGHTALLGIYINKHIKKSASYIKYIPDLLIQTEYQISQTQLNYKERILKKHTFKLNPAYKMQFKNKNIVIVDDTITTCSTINACAYELKKALHCNVFGVSFARTILH